MDISFRNEADNDKWKVFKSLDDKWFIFDLAIKEKEFLNPRLTNNESNHYQEIEIEIKKKIKDKDEDEYRIIYKSENLEETNKISYSSRCTL